MEVVSSLGLKSHFHKSHRTFMRHQISNRCLGNQVFFSFQVLKDVCDRKVLHTELFKVQYIIIQAIFSRKSMKKFTVTDEKDLKNKSDKDLRTSHSQRSEKGCQCGVEKKFITKRVH